ncbi:leucyl aminopeptidase [Sphingorhabdus sp. Alg239-R122]|uniref:leucyl aminopeptidase n=1 Tax=Sphingorhabdus sp. Alg239-R122 TaxID=2305989 RepID=UPI0013DADC3F|nr:leucyl aminopeptidase [Sphingorhabdus sp. Alg239-R122]
MKIQFQPSTDNADTICFPVSKGGLDSANITLAQSDLVRKAAVTARFKGNTGQVFDTFVEENDKPVRAILLGIGEKSADTAERDLEKAGGALTAKFLTSGVEELTVDLSGADVNGEAASSLLSGIMLRAWRHDQYRTKLPKNQRPSLEAVNIAGADDALQAAWPVHQAVAEGVALTRELVAEPANVIYPETFVQRCQHLTDLGVEITVLGVEEMEKLGMGALLGVGQGSVKPSRILAMRWKGEGADDKPVVFVGKGVTFDTGGISLKPGAGMEDMKWDMGGAGAVAGAMKALAGRKAKAHVVGVCGLVENMPDGNAQRPGDVVTSMSGQTIEVINTDAEGRLVLCDALHWAQEEYDPEYVIDLATLTGAIIISLGHEHAGMFTNDDGLADKLNAAAKSSGDPLWRFPISKAYDKLIDSPIADMKNVGPRGAGSITAAQFLHRYIKDGVKWAHLDIAGMVWADKPGPLWDKGATGFGVRLLDRFIADNFEK